MLYRTTITQKGQITIPKEIREVLKLKPSSRIVLELKNKEVKIKSASDILEMADKFKPKKKFSALKLRKKMEREYERF